MSKNSTVSKTRRSVRSEEPTISSPRAAGAEDRQSDTDEVFEGGGFTGVTAPISPVSVSADYEGLSLAEIKQNIERITWDARIDTPFWGSGGRLWIPLRDAELEQEVRQALRNHGFTVYEDTHKIGKLRRKGQVVFVVCLPPGKTTTRETNEEKMPALRKSLGRRPDSKVTTRRLFIQRIVARGLVGEDYCRELGAQFKTPVEWQKNYGCPTEYVDAYNHPGHEKRKKFRQLIWREKNRLAPISGTTPRK